MNAWAALIVGLLAGWLIEWVIDWLFWRRRRDERGGLVGLEAGVETAGARLAVAPDQAEREAMERSLVDLRAEVDRRQRELSEAQELQRRQTAELAESRDRLTAAQVESGRLQQQLNGARVTGVDLAKLQTELKQTQAQVEEQTTQLTVARQSLVECQAALRLANERAAAEVVMARRADERAMAAARQIDERRAAEAVALRQALEAAKAANARLQLDLAQASGRVERREQELTTARQAAGEASQLQATIEQLRGELQRLQMVEPAPAAARQTMMPPASPPQRDPLIDINGIGPVYEQRLFAAGILTFEQLIGERPARLREIVQAREWQDVDAEAWIAEARQFLAHRQEGGR